MRLTFLFLVFLATNNAMAAHVPVLSADNSLLSGVEVSGTLYDVSFGDGWIRDFYPEDVVSAPGWSDFSIDMIAAIVDGLNLQDRTVAAPDIPGCSAHSGIPEFAAIANYCFLYIPTYYWAANLSYEVGDVAAATPDGAISYSAQIYGRADLYGNTMGYGMSVPEEWVTLARITPTGLANVPIPTTLLLVLIALVGLCISRTQRITAIALVR